MGAVRSWLNASGISNHRIKHSVNRGWLYFKATTSEAETLLKTKFHEYEDVQNDRWAIGCDEYSLPNHIHHHIDYVTPGVKPSRIRKRSLHPRLDAPRRKRSFRMDRPIVRVSNLSSNLSNCNNVITPDCIAALYQIPEPATDINPGSSIGIFEDGDFYAQEDLNLFFANFTPQIPQGTHPTLDSIDGGQAPVPVEDAGGESDLDFQLAYPIVYPTEIVLYQVDDALYSSGEIPSQGFGNTFLDALDGSYCNYTAFNETGDDPTLDPTYPDPNPGGYNGSLECGTYKPTPVISISYGEQEIDLPAGYQERQCNEFMKLGLQGVSVFVASGDTGVAGVQEQQYPNGCIGPNLTVFNPTNPNSCPFLTNVGATMVNPNATVNDPESAAFEFFDNGTFLFTSSGGFSNIYPVPQYQQSAVDSYFANYNPPYPYYELTGGFDASKIGDGIYNRIGHGIPDVSANGVSIGVYNEGEFASFGGTSASSPIFASVVTRLNNARLNLGKSTIGFINPALYAHPEVLNDITNGTNPGCGTDGFKAVPGWDPVRIFDLCQSVIGC